MQYCFERGIPHSVFMKWEQDDRDKVLEYILWKNTLCPQCGTNPSDWLDDEGRGQEPPPYEVQVRRCLGCAMLEQTRDEIPKDLKFSALPYFVRRKPDGRGAGISSTLW